MERFALGGESFPVWKTRDHKIAADLFWLFFFDINWGEGPIYGEAF